MRLRALILAFVAALLAGCSGKEDIPVQLSADKSEVDVTCAAATVSVNLAVSDVPHMSSTASWCTLRPGKLYYNKIKVDVDIAENKSSGPRECCLTFSLGGRSVLVWVRQEGRESAPVEEPDPSEDDRKIQAEIAAVYITTPGWRQITSKDSWMTDATMQIVHEGGAKEDYGKIEIKGRGNTTWWSYPKKPYTIRLAEKRPVLGMPEGKRWNLLANWMDRTDIRNDVALEIARRTKSLGWTPSGRFVELYVNNNHQGNYYLCEKVSMSKNRVYDGPDGVLLELDVNYDEKFKFYSRSLALPVNVKEPDGDKMTDELFMHIQDVFNTAEEAVCAGNPTWRDLVDMDSFIDFWFVQELTFNWEPNHPKSCFLHFGTDGVIKAGPVWDFDWETFKPNDSHFRDKSSIWYAYMFRDPVFVARVKEKWTESREDFSTIPEYIDAIYEAVKPSVEADARQWPINQYVNGDESMSVSDAVARMRKSFSDRFNWMDSAIRGL